MKTMFIFLFSSLLSISVNAQVHKVDRQQTTEEKLNAEYCSGLFESTDGTILDVASNVSAKSYLNILDWLPGKVAGLQVYQNRNGVSVPFIRGGVPAVFIDEIQVSLSAVSDLNTNDIAIIKIIKTPFYGGFNGGNGAIAIYTRGDEDEDE